jgi:hypothetical protein
MKNGTKIYIVTAYRWGNRENHSYNLGVFKQKNKAIEVANENTAYRGGKYACVVEECELNHFSTQDDEHTKDVYFTESTQG